MCITAYRLQTFTFYVKVLCISLSGQTCVIWTLCNRERWLSWKPALLCCCCSSPVKMRACTHTHTYPQTHKDTHLWGTESVYLIHTSLHGMTLAAMSVLDQYYQAKFGSGLQFSHLPPNNKKEILSLRHRDQTCHSRVYYSLKLTIAHNGSTCSLKVQHITPTGHLIYLTSATKEHSVSDRAKP